MTQDHCISTKIKNNSFTKNKIQTETLCYCLIHYDNSWRVATYHHGLRISAVETP